MVVVGVVMVLLVVEGIGVMVLLVVVGIGVVMVMVLLVVVGGWCW